MAPRPSASNLESPKKPRIESSENQNDIVTQFVEPALIPSPRISSIEKIDKVTEPTSPIKALKNSIQSPIPSSPPPTNVIHSNTIPSISVFEKPAAESILHDLQVAKPVKKVPKQRSNMVVAVRSKPPSEIPQSPAHDSDNESTVSEAPSNLSTTSSRYSSRRAEVKEKIRLMKKDDNGEAVIDTATFPLGDLIYMSRHAGTKITGIQKRREQREKDRAILKEEHEKRSERASSIVSVKSIHDETRSLQKLSNDEITSKNKASFQSISVKTNEAGELILSDKPVIAHPEQQNFDRDNLEHEFEDNAEDRELFKRCFRKHRTKRTDRPEKVRRWCEKENKLFWEALSRVGQDFSLMEYYFKGKNVIRTKFELKTKFQREDRIHRDKVTEILKLATKKCLNASDFVLVELES